MRPTPVAVAAVILLALSTTGCVAGADEPDADSDRAVTAGESSGPAASDPPENTLASCLQGSWTEDLVNLRAQIPSTPGFELASLDGANTLTIDGDTLTYTVDYVTVIRPTIESPIHGQGITRGSTTHVFTLGDDTTDIFFSPATETTVVAEVTLFTGDEASEPQRFPWDGGFGDSGFVTCTDDSLTIDPDSSGRILLFTR